MIKKITAGPPHSVFRCDQQFRTCGGSAILAHHSQRVRPKSLINPQSLNLNDTQAVRIEIYYKGFGHIVTCI